METSFKWLLSITGVVLHVDYTLGYVVLCFKSKKKSNKIRQSSGKRGGNSTKLCKEFSRESKQMKENLPHIGVKVIQESMQTKTESFIDIIKPSMMT
jgi:hypothetical protein